MNPLPATRKSKPSLSISATCGRASARRRTSSASAIEVPPGSRQPHTHRLDAGTDSRNWMAHASRGHQRQAPAAGRGGTEGGATAQHLLERDRTVRALVRDPDSAAASALRRAGANLVVGDLDDPTSLRTAMEGVYGVFLVLTMMVGPKISPEGVVAEERRGKAVADLARESGIEHLVYSSLNGASARSGIPYYESKARIEEHIHALRLPATILRPVSFMDNFATYNRPVLDDGALVVSLAVRPELPMQLISVRDIGAFAAIAFDRPDQFLGRTVEIAGTYSRLRRSPRPSAVSAACRRVSARPSLSIWRTGRTAAGQSSSWSRLRHPRRAASRLW